jgi:hypothetical protein
MDIALGHIVRSDRVDPVVLSRRCSWNCRSGVAPTALDLDREESCFAGAIFQSFGAELVESDNVRKAMKYAASMTESTAGERGRSNLAQRQQKQWNEGSHHHAKGEHRLAVGFF